MVTKILLAIVIIVLLMQYLGPSKKNICPSSLYTSVKLDPVVYETAKVTDLEPVKIILDSGQNAITGMELNASFNPNAIEIIDIQKNPILFDSKHTANEIGGLPNGKKFDNTTGKIRYVMEFRKANESDQSVEKGMRGIGPVAFIRFRIKDTGITTTEIAVDKSSKATVEGAKIDPKTGKEISVLGDRANGTTILYKGPQ